VFTHPRASAGVAGRARIKSAAARAAAAIPAAAIALSLGGVASAATVAQSTPAQVRTSAAATSVTFHKLTLLNGWTSAANSFSRTGTPGYAISGGMVYLAGAVRATTGANKTFAVLPKAARPAHRIYVAVDTSGITDGTLRVQPNGTVQAYGTSARVFTSLAGVSYPAASTGLHALKLLFGWKSGKNPYHTGNPGYVIKNGVVHLSGSIQSGTTGFFATLPKAARPGATMILQVYTYGGTVGEFEIGPSGNMFATSVPAANATSFTSLEGISFTPASVSSHKLTLLNGWKPGQSTSAPAYVVKAGVVYLSGLATQQLTASNLIAVLPKAARPAHLLFLKTLVASASSGGVLIYPNGHILAYSVPSGDIIVGTSFAALSYPRSS
jgi:hypothetical protein